jgi:hypothetical protein
VVVDEVDACLVHSLGVSLGQSGNAENIFRLFVAYTIIQTFIQLYARGRCGSVMVDPSKTAAQVWHRQTVFVWLLFLSIDLS